LDNRTKRGSVASSSGANDGVSDVVDRRIRTALRRRRNRAGGPGIARIRSLRVGTATEHDIAGEQTFVLATLPFCSQGIHVRGRSRIVLERRRKRRICQGGVTSLLRGLSIQKLALIARGDPTLSRADKEVERVMKEGGEMLTGGYDLPAEADAVRRASAAEPAAGPDGKALNRRPGSLLGR